ncbi:hypothetical protein WS68_03925 [Burkholderia sp. TSV86]|nr:hypothetical protein WS68_03925 [Burkholderia sp. TSV86]
MRRFCVWRARARAQAQGRDSMQNRAGRDRGNAVCARARGSQPRHDGWAVRQRAAGRRRGRGFASGLGGGGFAA